MKHFMPKGETVAGMMFEAKSFFADYDIDVKDFPQALYEELYYAFLANSLETLSDWSRLPILGVMGTLADIYEDVRKEDVRKVYYNVHESIKQVDKALCRYYVQVENIYHHPDEAIKTKNLKEIMERFYCAVLDDVTLEIKRQLRYILGDSTWDIYDIVIVPRDIYLVNYGDYRILSWKKLYFAGK